MVTAKNNEILANIANTLVAGIPESARIYTAGNPITRKLVQEVAINRVLLNDGLEAWYYRISGTIEPLVAGNYTFVMLNEQGGEVYSDILLVI